MDSGSFQELGSYESQARALVDALRMMPDYSDAADWLASRLDEIDVARQIAAAPPPHPPPCAPAAGHGRDRAQHSARRRPRLTPASPPAPAGRRNGSVEVRRSPYYDRWLERLRNRPPPANADALDARPAAGLCGGGRAAGTGMAGGGGIVPQSFGPEPGGR